MVSKIQLTISRNAHKQGFGQLETLNSKKCHLLEKKKNNQMKS